MARKARLEVRVRTRVEIGGGELFLTLPDGRERAFALEGADLAVGDATFTQRFVRHIHLETGYGELDLITPPEQGAIAPRAAQLPRAPDDAGVVDRAAFDTLVEWLVGGGRLGGRTIEDLARLSRLASPAFAVVIGERAGQLAIEGTWPYGGPMRGGGLGDDLRRRLQPLEAAARDSERAGEALVAALSACAGERG
ncbi:MAG TPA: hypothetical protein VIG06_07515 [Kofleriaceae bacterium]